MPPSRLDVPLSEGKHGQGNHVLELRAARRDKRQQTRAQTAHLLLRVRSRSAQRDSSKKAASTTSMVYVRRLRDDFSTPANRCRILFAPMQATHISATRSR